MGTEVRDTLLLIANARLRHPSGALLSSFVTDALNPILAARYVNNRLQEDDRGSLASDWSYIVEASTYFCPPFSEPAASCCHPDATKLH